MGRRSRLRLIAWLLWGPTLSVTALGGAGCSDTASAMNADAADAADASVLTPDGGGATDAPSLESVEPEAATDPGPCQPVCDKNADWHPAALCEDFQGQQAGAYFCRVQTPSDHTCEQSCNDALAAAPTAECRASWEGFLSCLKDAPSYSDAVLGQYIACDGAIVALMSSCWEQQASLSAQTLWAAKNLSRYSFRLARTDAADGSEDGAWTVTVNGMQTVQVPETPPAPSIGDIFQKIAATVAGGQSQTAACSYDPALGYPTEVLILKPRAQPNRPTLDVAARYSIDDFTAVAP